MNAVGERTVIAKVAVENSGKHQRFIENCVDPCLVRLNANNAVLRERACTIRKQADALEHILDDHRLEDV